MERKRALSDTSAKALAAPCAKKQCSFEPASNIEPPCKPPDTAPLHPLFLLLSQYGLLTCLVENITAKDLRSLALTSRTAYAYVFPSEKSWRNLTGRTRCDGRGIRIRQQYHKLADKSMFSKAEEYVKCGSDDMSRTVPTKPCISCGFNTCDECRIHVFYQSLYQPREAEDELPFYSGFFMLEEFERPILSPRNFDFSSDEEWQEPNGQYPRPDPHHDKGWIGSAFPLPGPDSYTTADALLHKDLGRHRPFAHPSGDDPCRDWPISPTFRELIEDRALLCCPECFQKSFHSARCHCTLKSRFLDRWLCLECYTREQRNLKSMAGYEDALDGKGAYRRKVCCSEGVYVPDSEYMRQPRYTIVCLWCKGQLSRSRC